MMQIMPIPPEPRFQYQQENRHEKMLWTREGIAGWWFNLSAPPRPADMSSLRVREFIRKGETTSLIILATAAFLVAIVSNSFSDPSTAIASIVMAVALVIAVMLNRAGKVVAAAYLTVIMMMLAIMGSLLGAKGGLRLVWFPAFDLLSLPVFASYLIIGRRVGAVCTLVAIVFILLYYAYEPHALISGYGAHNFDEMLYEVNQPYFSWYALINRDISLIFFAGLFGWIAESTFRWALNWGEQANNEAKLATAVAQYKEQSAQELSQFVQEITQSFAALGNGQVRFLQQRAPGDPLHDAIVFLNGQLQMVESVRKRRSSAQAEQTLTELQRLSELYNQVRTGAAPVQMLYPGKGRFLSPYEEINLMAKQLYELLTALARLSRQAGKAAPRTMAPLNKRPDAIPGKSGPLDQAAGSKRAESDLPPPTSRLPRSSGPLRRTSNNIPGNSDLPGQIPGTPEHPGF